MKISILSRLVTVTTILMLCAMGTVIFRALSIQNSIVTGELHHQNSHRLSDELFQSIEDLTRMARSYVTTGDPVYERNYFEIQDIRDGKRPRPKNYSGAYWHLSGIDKAPPAAQGEAVSLLELMRHENFSDREFNLLRESLANSEDLIDIEKQAFAAVKGLYKDDQGAFTIHRAPDQNFAIGLLYGDRYIDAKTRIMLPIHQFDILVDERANANLEALQARLHSQIWLLIALAIFALAGMVFFIVYTRRAVLHPLELLNRNAEEISHGNYVARCDINSGNELAKLCAYFNNMAMSIERDIAERKRLEEKLRSLSYFDSLTGLPNRVLLTDRVQQALANAKRDKTGMALMFIDLDEFKPVNDAFGHAIGDLLLKEVANRMQYCVRESDTIARMGGDEFVVLLPNIEKKQDSMIVAEKIRHVLNQPFKLADHTINISSSIGIAVYPEHGNDDKSLLRNADAAMYTAKESGRNTVRFFSSG